MTKRSTPALLPLSDDPTQPQFMRELLQAGRDASMSDYNFEQGLTKHLALIETGAPTPQWAEALRTGAGAAPTAGGASLLPWLAVPVVAAAMVTAAVFVARQTAPQVPSVQAPVVPAASAPASVAKPSTVPTPVAPQAVPRVQAPAVSPTAATASREASSARPASGAARAVRNDRRTHAAAAARSVANTTVGVPAVASNSKQATAPGGTELFAHAQPAVASRSGASQAAHVEEPATAVAADKPEAQVARNVPVQPTQQDDSKLEREMSMLAMTQRVLLTDPARALGLARQGEAEFAGSMFTQERQQLLLLSLVRLGRLDEAKRLAKPYLTHYPAGPFSDRVRHALATGKVER